MKSIGRAPEMYEPTANESTCAPAVLEEADALRIEAAADDDLDVAEALLVEPSAALADELRRDAAALGGSVEADAVQPIAERARDAQRLLCLVAERVDEDDARHVRRHVAVKRLGRADRVAKDEHQRVGHRAGRCEAGQARAGRRRGADTAADDRGVVERVGHVRMDVARAERDDRLRRGRVDAFARGGGPARRLGQHPEQRGLVQAEGAISRANAHHHFLAARSRRHLTAPRSTLRPVRPRRTRVRAASWPRRSRTARRRGA